MSCRVIDQDRGYRALQVRARKMGRSEVRVGVTDAPHAPGGEPTSFIGLIHELGLGHVSQRSFLRAWVDENQRGIFAWLKERVYRALMGRGAWEKNFGEYAVEGIRTRMRLGIMPPLLEATTRRKANGSTPLIETEQLINGIEYEVQKS